MKRIISLTAILLLVAGCTIHTGVGIIPDGPEYWEEDDPHFMLLGETKTKPVQAFFLHASSVTGVDPSWGYNLIGISATFDVDAKFRDHPSAPWENNGRSQGVAGPWTGRHPTRAILLRVMRVTWPAGPRDGPSPCDISARAVACRQDQRFEAPGMHREVAAAIKQELESIHDTLPEVDQVQFDAYAAALYDLNAATTNPDLMRRPALCLETTKVATLERLAKIYNSRRGRRLLDSVRLSLGSGPDLIDYELIKAMRL